MATRKLPKRPLLVKPEKLKAAIKLLMLDCYKYKDQDGEVLPEIKERMKRAGIWGLEVGPDPDKAASEMAEAIIHYLNEVRP